MATIRRRGTKWQAQIRLHGHPATSRTFTLKNDAEVWARQVEASVERGDFPDSLRSLKGINLRQLLERYEQTITPLKKGRAAEKYLLRTIKSHPIASLCLDKLTPAMVTNYRDERLRTVSPSSVRRELAILQHCLEVAKNEWGVALQQNPVSKIKKPAPGKARERRITVEELERLRTALDNCRNGLLSNITQFAIHTGMRRGEILSIRWSDINFDAGTVYLADTKNGEARTVPVSSLALAALPATDNRAMDERVFPLSPNAVRLGWERLKRRAGINDLDFHDLRHEAISRFFELGLSIPEVALISGHRDFKNAVSLHASARRRCSEKAWPKSCRLPAAG
jgi:integrase